MTIADKAKAIIDSCMSKRGVIKKDPKRDLQKLDPNAKLTGELDGSRLLATFTDGSQMLIRRDSHTRVNNITVLPNIGTISDGHPRTPH